MHRGIFSCGPETELIGVARLMARHDVHAVVVIGIEADTRGGERLSWGLITALDLVSAALSGNDALDAGALAGTEIVTVGAEEPLTRAAQLMAEHQLSHLLVVSGSIPIGVVSTLDVAGCIAWGET